MVAASSGLDDLIEVVESGYEFLLAYAAQGRKADAAGSGKSEVRETLEGMREAALAIAGRLEAVEQDFAAIVVEDARRAVAALSLVVAQPAIGSELVDNLNVSSHVRTFLTDLFLLAETDLGAG